MKVVDPVTDEGPLFGRHGLLLVMLGHVGDPERNAEVIRDRWYVTGDIATVDDAGFVRITDRLSRFSKIAGEMVPHMKIGETLRALIGSDHVCLVPKRDDLRFVDAIPSLAAGKVDLRGVRQPALDVASRRSTWTIA